MRKIGKSREGRGKEGMGRRLHVRQSKGDKKMKRKKVGVREKENMRKGTRK